MRTRQQQMQRSCGLGRGRWYVMGASSVPLCSASSNYRMVVGKERSGLVAGTGTCWGKQGLFFLAHRHACGCDPVAVCGWVARAVAQMRLGHLL